MAPHSSESLSAQLRLALGAIDETVEELEASDEPIMRERLDRLRQTRTAVEAELEGFRRHDTSLP